jgi:dihydrolipoamide dehydrogenase
LPTVDRQIASDADRQFKQQGLDIRLNTTVKGASSSADSVTISYADNDGDHELEVDRLVVAVGRQPYTKDLLAPEIGVDLDEHGFINVDEHCRTSVPGVYAVGDVVRGPMLAHKGSEEGVAVAERIAGQSAHVNYHVIPWVIYTHPEIAWVGHPEQDLKKAGISYNAGMFPFAATGRALAVDDTAGRVKILAHKHTDEVLGVHIIGPQASELIAEVVIAMEFSASAEDIARTVHAHPTLSEAVHEAALSVHKRAIHRAN